MRTYHLSLGISHFFSQDQLTKNGLHIEFNIQAFEGNNVTNSVIKLFSPPPALFSNLTNLIGLPVVLTAGTYYDPLSKKANGSFLKLPMDETLIYSGFIANLVPNWDDINFSLSVICTPEPVTTTPLPPVPFIVASGVPAMPAIGACYAGLIRGPFPIIPPADPLISPQEFNTSFRNIKELFDFVYTTWGYQFALTPLGYKMINKEIPAAGVVHVLSKKDFISQPKMINYSEVELSINLNGKIKIYDLVVLPTDIYVGVSWLSNFFGSTQGQAGAPKTFVSGQWRVTSVWHLGGSRNTDPNSWATNIRAANII